MYPYAVPISTVQNLDGAENLYDSKTIPISTSTGVPVHIKKHYKLADAYTLLNDVTENGLEGPTVWS
jgi:hypothetical protein